MLKFTFTLICLFFLFSFLFAENEGFIINKIIFSGNHLVKNEILQNVILSNEGDTLDYQQVNDDAQRILSYYSNIGMRFVIVQYPDKVPVSNALINICFYIQEENKIIIKDIDYEGIKYFNKDKLNSIINPSGKSYSLDDLETIKNKILNLYLERGFLFTEISFIRLDFLEFYTLILKVDEGKQCFFENVIINKGIVSTEKSLLKICGLKKNTLITQNLIENAESNLNLKEYIQDAKIIPLDPKTLLLNINETRMTKISGILGYNNTENESKLVGSLNFKFLNLFGADRSLDFNWRRLRKDQSYIKFEYYEPGPYALQIGSVLNFERETMDSTYIKVLTSIDLFYYDTNNRYGISFGLNDINPGSRVNNSIEKSSQNYSGLFWSYNGFDYLQNPRKGSSFNFRYKYILEDKDNVNIKRQALEGQFDFVQKLTNQYVFFTSLNGKYIENKSLSFYDLYKVGGTFSLRGFKEDNFSGNKIAWINTELRYLIDRDARLFIFLDYGIVQDERPDINSFLNDLFGIGLGLRFNTRLGLMRIDYAFHHESGKWSHPLDGFIHFGLESSL